MELSERSEEILEMLWIKTLEEGRSGVPQAEIEAAIDQAVGTSPGQPCPFSESGKGCVPVNELQSAGYIVREPDGFRLTETGRPLAENVVRRHRLAERLFTDVLDAWNETNHEKACKFEHLLDKGLDDSICTLLGHPRVCPHGKPIPEGKCCREARVFTTRLVSPLSELSEGQKGKVAYISAKKRDQLQKLTAMGVLPGASLTALQRSPAFVFQAGQTQFAVDREIADSIYVRLNEGQEASAAPSHNGRRRMGLGWGRRSG